jgi:hypothetical protein
MSIKKKRKNTSYLIAMHQSLSASAQDNRFIKIYQVINIFAKYIIAIGALFLYNEGCSINSKIVKETTKTELYNSFNHRKSCFKIDK